MSDAPAGGRFDAIVRRLHGLHPRLIDLSLDRLRRLLDRAGNPERHLPPVLHVAGTNGKGSTCAFLRAIGEAAAKRVHVFTSPHLVSFNERIRLAGTLVDDATLADALDHLEALNAGAPITVFEIVTAAALWLFARVPADWCVLEVGLGGEFDATNVVARPAAAAITSISMDHREFLGDSLAAIAAAKAGIVKPGCPAVSGSQSPEVAAVLDAAAAHAGVQLSLRGRNWQIAPRGEGLRYEDDEGSLDLPAPGLAGRHQHDNAGIAVAALRRARLTPADAAVARGVAAAQWPARLQRLRGTLARSLPPGWELWLDGGHNVGAATMLAEHLAGWMDRPLALVIGMKHTKDPAGFLRPLLPFAKHVYAVAEPGQHLAVAPPALVAASGGVAQPGPDVRGALAQLPDGVPGRVLICGSLYLAGEVLRADGGSQH